MALIGRDDVDRVLDDTIIKLAGAPPGHTGRSINELGIARRWIELCERRRNRKQQEGNC